nr:MAG TPA: hypothetical protein [Caudoviricetes sp.]
MQYLSFLPGYRGRILILINKSYQYLLAYSQFLH